MDRLLALRETVLKDLETAREDKLIGNSLEAQVRLKLPAADRALVDTHRGDLCSLFIVSSVVIEPEPAGAVEVSVSRAPGKKCRAVLELQPRCRDERGPPRILPAVRGRCRGTAAMRRTSAYLALIAGAGHRSTSSRKLSSPARSRSTGASP